MTNVNHETIEDLLRHAEPRPTPPAEVAEAARAAVRAEWRASVGQRQRRRRVAGFAAAATLVLGLMVAPDLLRAPALPVLPVASIDKSFGSVYVLGERAELRETRDLSEIMAGQTIVTGRAAGLAVAWGDGGSLRLDRNTRVEFSDAESVFLREGRVYFDSRRAALASGVDDTDMPVLNLRTARGVVRHVGTQYMVQVDGDALIVSVREGEVAIDGEYFDHTASRGEQVTLSGSQRPSVLSISGNGADWEWLEDTTPAVDVDGRSLHEFLTWVCRELGLQLVFVGDAETVARNAILRGSIDSRPADSLRMRLASAALAWHVDQGVIYVGGEP